MKRLLCFYLFALLSSFSLSAQIMVSLPYPTDSIAIIDPLQDLPDVLTTDITFTQPSRGVVTLLPNGTLQYVANSMTDVAYSDEFNFSVFDGSNYYNSSVIIFPEFDDPMPNVPPLGSNFTHSVCSDQANPTPSTIHLGFHDLNYDVPEYSIIQNALHGTLNFIADGQTVSALSYLPELGFTGIDTVIFRACESNTAEQYCVDGLISITISDCWITPVQAWEDLYYMLDTTAITMNPLQYDFADISPVTVHIVSQGHWGTAVVNPDNTLTYSLNDTVPLISDQLTYYFCDALGNCSDTVAITIVGTAPNWQTLYPISTYFTIAPQQSLMLDFLPDSIYAAPEIYIDTILNQLQYGTLELVNDGVYQYTPFDSLVATEQSTHFIESINYFVCMPYSNCVLNTLYITIVLPNCIDDNVDVPYQNSVVIPVLDNDTGAGALNLHSLVALPQHGTVTINNNQLLYQADSLYYGDDAFQYIACDSYNNCDTAMIHLYINANYYLGNLPPIPEHHSVDFCKEYSFEWGINFFTGLGIQYGETFAISITEAPQFGTAYFDNTSLYYTPLPTVPANETYSDTLHYTICETNTVEQYCTDNELILHVLDCNSASLTANDSYVYVNNNSFPEIIIPVNVEADFWNTINIIILNEGQYGTVLLQDNQTISYALNNSIAADAVDSIRYVACNELGVCDTATVYIHSLGYECCTLTVSDFYSVVAGMSQSLAVLENDFPNLHIAGIAVAPQYGSVSFTDTAVQYISTPQQYNQYDQFAYIACDDLGRCDTATVYTQAVIHNDSIVINYVPVAYSNYYTICEENVLDIWHTAYDPNAQDSIQCTFSQLPLHGTIDTVFGYNSVHIIYTPDDNYEGVDTIRCVWCETNTNEHYCTEAFLSINVYNCYINFAGQEDNVQLYRDSTMTATINVLANDSNEDSLAIASVSLVSPPNIGTAIVNADNTLSYTYVDTTDCYTTSYVDVSLMYAVCSVSGICDTVPVNIHVVFNIPAEGYQEVLVSRSHAKTLTGIEAHSILIEPSQGTAVINPDNSITYIPYSDSIYLNYPYDYLKYATCEPYHFIQKHDVDFVILNNDQHLLDAIVARDDYSIAYTIINIAVLENDDYVNINDTDFLFYYINIIEQGSHGSAFRNGSQSIQYIPYNEVLLDSFRYVLCSYMGDVCAANPVQMCDTATVYILPPCNNSCLYPGDVNNDQTVNILDLLAFGMAPATTGSPRPNASTAWVGQEGTAWDGYYTYRPFGETLFLNQSLADCNGDGTITPTDASLIQTHYGKSHIEDNNPFAVPVHMFPSNDAPLIRLDLPITVDTVGHYSADIYLATPDQAAEDMYGVGFSLQFPPEQIPLDSVRFYIADSWLGNGNDMVSITHLDGGEAHIALSRRDGQGRAGYGKIGSLSFYVNSIDTPAPPNQSLNVSIDETYYSTNIGIVDLLRHETTSQLLIAIGVEPSPATPAPIATQLRVYPNPTRELLNLVVAPDQQIQSITVTDMMGRRLFSPALPDSVGYRAAVSVQHLPEGLYLVEVQTNVGVGVQRVMVK